MNHHSPHTQFKPRIAKALQPFGETIFTEISRLAHQHNAVNLGQGFPNFDGPEFVKQAAVDAINAGHGQYARMFGIPELNRAIGDRFQMDTVLVIDPDREVTVTSGCTEAIAATLLGVLNPGDEVILFEPYYDSYRACVALAGAQARCVTLRPPDFSFDASELTGAINSSTRAILVNTPHNPTGKVFSHDELEVIASLCMKHDLIAITDEVYERLVFEGKHISLATFPGMRERTVTLSSLGKSFSLTGWKIGWSIAMPHLTAAVRAAHQFLTFATATPLQHGAVTALRAPQTYYTHLLTEYRRKRDLLVSGLQQLGFGVYPPRGTYFVVVDHTPFGFDTDVAFCRHLIEKIGVAAIPTSVFYDQPARGKSMVRFAFCKTDDVLHEALRRMKALKRTR